jgi:hypothetical protein
MALQANSQSTLLDTRKIKCQVINGDTVITMPLSDAKVVLKGILDAEIADSLLRVYVTRDKINNDIIQLQVKEIKALQEKTKNEAELSNNLQSIIQNKDTEIADLNAIIKKQKKEIRKQKFIKTIALIGDVALPVLVLLAITLHG